MTSPLNRKVFHPIKFDMRVRSWLFFFFENIVLIFIDILIYFKVNFDNRHKVFAILHFVNEMKYNEAAEFYWKLNLWHLSWKSTSGRTLLNCSIGILILASFLIERTYFVVACWEWIEHSGIFWQFSFLSVGTFMDFLLFILF